jgi:Na+-transporting NADH:ubiquinone oxidoreductase subunit NqrC
MTDEINFLAKHQQKLAKRDREDKKSLLVVIVLATICGIIYGGIWYVNDWYHQQIAQVQYDQEQVTQLINQNSTRERDYLVFYEKLTKLAELIQKRTHGTESLVDTHQYFTSDHTAVVASTYDYYTQSMEYTLGCNNVFALPKLLSLVQDPEFTSQYRNMELGSLYRRSDGTYQLTVFLDL